MTRKWILAVIVVSIASLSVAGCTSENPSPSPTPAESQLKAFTAAYHDNVLKNLGPKETLRTWNETTQANDVMRVRYSTYNSTTSAYNTNGTTIYDDIKIQKFASTADASTFADDKSFGYMPVSPNNSTTLNSTDLNKIYNRAMSHDPTTTTGYVKLDSFTFVTAQVSFVMQADEFVVYGSSSSMAGAGSSTGSATGSSSVSPPPTYGSIPSSSATPHSSPSLTPLPSASPTATPTITPTPHQQTYTVSIVNFAFQPSTMTIPRGATVMWRNAGSTTHTVTAGAFSSGNLSPGATFTHQFTQAGTYSYHCSIHPSMTGTITVQ